MEYKYIVNEERGLQYTWVLIWWKDREAAMTWSLDIGGSRPRGDLPRGTGRSGMLGCVLSCQSLIRWQLTSLVVSEFPRSVEEFWTRVICCCCYASRPCLGCYSTILKDYDECLSELLKQRANFRPVHFKDISLREVNIKGLQTLLIIS